MIFSFPWLKYITIRKTMIFQFPFLSRLKIFITRNKSFCNRVNPIHKQGQMLEKMIQNRDKRKTWHFEILQNHAKSKNVFDKISRPSKRQTVLNHLFIKNITDVISTGEIPEVFGLGIEITGVKIGSCCKIINIFWQTSFTHLEESYEDIGMILNRNASKIRSELISRNVMGYVPIVVFVRDITNSYLSAFEKAMKEADLGPENEQMIVPDDTFIQKKKLYKFDSKTPAAQKSAGEGRPEEAAAADPAAAAARAKEPPRPDDMRSDVFGLPRDVLMARVAALKTKPRAGASHVIVAPDWGGGEDSGGDLFDKIPGETIHGDSERERLFKKFYVERRKMRLAKSKAYAKDCLEFVDSLEEDQEPEPEPLLHPEEDYIYEDERPDKV